MSPSTLAPSSFPALASPAARPAWVALAIWFAAAFGLALAGALTVERRYAIPLVLVGLVVSQVLRYRRGGAWRALADALDDRALVLFHVVRAPIGAAFLFLVAHGLDPDFARIAGYGDVASGLGALVVGLGLVRARRVVLAWNLFAFVDILAVVLTAQRILIFSDHPWTMQTLVNFPGALLPTFLVPLVISTHLLLFVRLRRAA